MRGVGVGVEVPGPAVRAPHAGRGPDL